MDPFPPAVAAALHGSAIDSRASATARAGALAADAGPAQGTRVSVGDGAGGTYVAWVDTRDGLGDIYLLRVTNTGAVAAGWPATGLAVCTAGGHQVSPSLIPDGSNGVIVTWWDERNGLVFSNEGWAQRVTSAGVPLWSADGVKYIDNVHRPLLVVSADGTGGMLAAWTAGSTPNVYAIRLDGSGSVPAGWSASGTVVCPQASMQSAPAITGDGAGGAYVAWLDARAGSHIYAQHLNASAVVQWAPGGMILDAALFAGTPAVASDGSGGALFAWSQFGAVVAQRVDAAGATQWGSGVTLATPLVAVGVGATTDGLGGMIVTWIAFDGVSMYTNLAQRVDPSGTPQWGTGGVALSAPGPSSLVLGAVTPDGSGGGFFSWVTFPAAYFTSLHAQYIGSNGSLPWGASGLTIQSDIFTGYFTPLQIAPDGSGGLTVGWAQINYGSSYVTVVAQRVNAAGTPQLGTGAVVFNDNGSQLGAPVVADGAGGGWVLWTQGPDGSLDVAARHVLSTGVSAGPTLAVTNGAGDQILVAAVSDGAGGVIAVWHARSSGTLDLYAQRISAAGTLLWGASGVAVCTASGLQVFGGAVSDGSGGVVVSWTDYRDAGTSYKADIYAQRVSSAGTAMWAANGVAAVADTNVQLLSEVVATSGGGVIVTWYDQRNQSTSEIYGQRFDGAGAPQWTANGVSLASGFVGLYGTTGDGADGLILVTGRYVTAAGGFDVDSTEYRAHRFDGSGSPLWGSGLVAYHQLAVGQYDQVISDGAGGAYLVWADDRAGASDIYLQRITSAGTASFGLGGTPVCTAPGGQVPSSMFVSGSADVTVTWSDERAGRPDAYVQRIASNGSAAWTANGVPLCNETRGQYGIGSAPDGASGGVFAWTDYRSGTERLIYTQRLNSSGVAQWTDDGVVAVTVSLAAASATPERVALEWVIAGADQASIERTENGVAWTALATVATDGSGRIAYEDRAVTPGARYGYRLALVTDGAASHGGDVWVEVPAAPVFRLVGVTPNPARGRTWRVSFALASRERARLEVLDLAGRVVAARELTGFEPGNHELQFDRTPKRPGVYFMRLTQGPRSLTARVVALRE